MLYVVITIQANDVNVTGSVNRSVHVGEILC